MKNRGTIYSLTWAAITLCLSAIKLHFAHVHSRWGHFLLWPFSQEITPWLRHLAHLGFRAPVWVTGYSTKPFMCIHK